MNRAVDFFIVDGYNLLHRVLGFREGADLSAQRARVEVLVRGFLRARVDAAVLLVWDGALDVARPFERADSTGRLEVEFARPPQSADDRILQLCHRWPTRGAGASRVTVVTSDRKDIVANLPRGVRSMSSESFAHLVDETLEGDRAPSSPSTVERRDGPEKPPDVSDEETARWLEAFDHDRTETSSESGSELTEDEVEEWLRAFTDDENETESDDGERRT